MKNPDAHDLHPLLEDLLKLALLQTFIAGKSEELMRSYWKNTWQENFLYEMDLDYNYRLLKPGQIMGIPSTTNAYAAYKSDGLMDPRYRHLSHHIMP